MLLTWTWSWIYICHHLLLRCDPRSSSTSRVNLSQESLLSSNTFSISDTHQLPIKEASPFFLIRIVWTITGSAESILSSYLESNYNTIARGWHLHRRGEWASCSRFLSVPSIQLRNQIHIIRDESLRHKRYWLQSVESLKVSSVFLSNDSIQGLNYIVATWGRDGTVWLMGPFFCRCMEKLLWEGVNEMREKMLKWMHTQEVRLH